MGNSERQFTGVPIEARFNRADFEVGRDGFESDGSVDKSQKKTRCGMQRVLSSIWNSILESDAEFHISVSNGQATVVAVAATVADARRVAAVTRRSIPATVAIVATVSAMAIVSGADVASWTTSQIADILLHVVDVIFHLAEQATEVTSRSGPAAVTRFFLNSLQRSFDPVKFPIHPTNTTFQVAQSATLVGDFVDALGHLIEIPSVSHQ